MGDTETQKPEAVTGHHELLAKQEPGTKAQRKPLSLDDAGRAVGKIAHDFNNILTIINGYSAMLAGRFDLAEDVRADLASIARAGERAAQLTLQLSECGQKMRSAEASSVLQENSSGSDQEF